MRLYANLLSSPSTQFANEELRKSVLEYIASNPIIIDVESVVFALVSLVNGFMSRQKFLCHHLIPLFDFKIIVIFFQTPINSSRREFLRTTNTV